jgi:hypothetical protein
LYRAYRQRRRQFVDETMVAIGLAVDLDPLEGRYALVAHIGISAFNCHTRRMFDIPGCVFIYRVQAPIARRFAPHQVDGSAIYAVVAARDSNDCGARRILDPVLQVIARFHDELNLHVDTVDFVDGDCARRDGLACVEYPLPRRLRL